MGTIRFVAAALVVDGEGRQRQSFNGLDDEVDQIILGDPVAQIGRQEQRGVAVAIFETAGHEAKMNDARRLQVSLKQIPF